MIATTHIYISQKGGSIICFKGEIGRIFRSCSASHCLYSSDLHSAKAYLDKFEFRSRLSASLKIDPPAQSKTTLKWNVDGELSSVDMARIIDRISNPDLTKCDLACSTGD